MGGTNPDAIGVLQRAGINVLQSDHLHGKVYLFDTAAIVGSSNASANGLSLQDKEVRGWHEANILITEPSTLGSIHEWFEKLPKRRIGPVDLIAAREAWSRRRRSGVDKPPKSKSTLIEDLRKDPAPFGGRRIFICAYSEGLSLAGEKSLKHARKQATPEASETVNGFEWPGLPDFADLICFFKKNGRFYHDGLMQMPESRQEIIKYGTKFQICHELESIDGYRQTRIGSASAWTPALKTFMQDGDDPSANFLDLREFAEKYLRRP
jgi:hypothetical protein